MIKKIKASKSEKIIFVFIILLAIFSFGSFFLIKDKCLFVKDYDPKKINLKYIVLCEDLSISKINTAGIPDSVMKTLILDIKFDEKYFERVIHHEVFHIINDSFKEIFNEKEWSNFNVKNFKYAECSTCTDKLGLDTYSNSEGFFTEYSQSTASEDMAEVFSHLMIGLDFDNNDPILDKKIQFIKKNLLKIDKNFIL